MNFGCNLLTETVYEMNPALRGATPLYRNPPTAHSALASGMTMALLLDP